MKFVDISGYGHSGKGVITDLLKEINGFNVPEYNFEFNLLRIQGGLIDLKFALVDNWSPIRSDAAIRKFNKLIKQIGPQASALSPKTLFTSNGMNYDKIFNGQFTKLSSNYLTSLIDFQFEGEWPYQLLDEPGLKQFAQRLQSKLKIKTHHTSIVNVTSIKESEFLLLTKNYLNDLFLAIKNEFDDVMVTHNAIEPFNPLEGLKLFNKGKSIIVQRDPRDIYASTFTQLSAFIPKYETKYMWELKKNMLGINDINQFCHRQLIYYNQTNLFHDSNILRLRFEEIILDYQNVLNKIYKFLDIDKSIHVEKGKYFNPEYSKKNIGIWKNLPDQKAISKIEEQLKPYCFYEY